jgi:protein N-terminal methyltransferase
VTETVLTKYFEKTDLVERFKKHLDAGKGKLEHHPRIGCFYNADLQTVHFEHSYDIVWLQWVVSYLDDRQLVGFLRRCRLALAPHGLVLVKDTANAKGHDFCYLSKYILFIRSADYLRELFEEAGLEVVYSFPVEGLFASLEPYFSFLLRSKPEGQRPIVPLLTDIDDRHE